MIGFYKTLKARRYSVASQTFELPAGATVEVTQEDKERNKLLFNFAGGAWAWKHKSTLANMTAA